MENACFDGIALRTPGHVGHLPHGAEVLLRGAVTVEAPPHVERLGLLHRGHLIDAAVAGDAADALVHVDGVVEVDEVGDIVDLRPDDRRALDEAPAERFEERALVPDLRVAVEAELRGRDPRVRRAIDRGVAEAAVDAFVAGVVAVIELDRLLDRILHPARDGAAHVEEQSPEAAPGSADRDQKREFRQSVVFRAEQRSHSGLACI
jgi:hypothetical protein